MEKKQIELTREQREELERFSTTGTHSVRLVNRAKIILSLDRSEGRTAETHKAIADRLGVSTQTVMEARNAFIAADSPESFLRRKKRMTPPVPPKVTGELEARIIAIACGEAPEGRARWTLQLIADKCVELRLVDSISSMSICRVLKKTNSSRT